MAFIEERSGELVYMRSTEISARHAFTTRYGGVSTGHLSSLNLGSNRGDDPECVKENYRRVCALMGAAEDGCAVTKQVHGNVVKIVDESDRHIPLSEVPYEADGIVTAVRGMPIMCFVADCVPALLCDEKHGVIAAVHCGWRSSVGDILGEAVKKMVSLGAKVEDIHCAMGAAIGRCHFETDDDVPQAVEKYLGGDTEGLFDRRADGKTMVDLRLANKRRLIQLGVPAENVDISHECTYCSHEKYWSHRYTKGMRGSLAAVIVLE